MSFGDLRAFRVEPDEAAAVVSAASFAAYEGLRRYESEPDQQTGQFSLGDWNWIRWESYLRVIGPLIRLDEDDEFEERVLVAFEQVEQHLSNGATEFTIANVMADIHKDQTRRNEPDEDADYRSYLLSFLKRLTWSRPMYVKYEDVNRLANAASVAREDSAYEDIVAFYFQRALSVQNLGPNLAEKMNYAAKTFARAAVFRQFGPDAGIRVVSAIPRVVGAIVQTASEGFMNPRATWLLSFNSELESVSSEIAGSSLQVTITPVAMSFEGSHFERIFNNLLACAEHTVGQEANPFATTTPIEMKMAPRFLDSDLGL